jgi:hypothetical protein
VPEGDEGLRRRRPGQRLADRDDLGVRGVVDPLPTLDELRPEVAQVGDRTAERGQPQAQRDGEDLAGRARRGC